MSQVIGQILADDSPVLGAGGMIVCKYTCVFCGLVEQEVSVHARTGEDVVQWFRMVMTPALMHDHSRRSPDCHPTEFESVLVPIPPGTEKIGGPVIQ